MARSRYLKWDNGTDSPANDLPPDTWRVGDYRENDDQTSPIVRWRCTVAGTPGTWVPLYGGFGILSPAPNSVMVAIVDYDAVVANGVTVYGSGTFGTANDATGKFGYAASTGVLATDIQTAWDAAVLTPFKTLEAVGKAYPRNGGNGANLRIVIRGRTSLATYRNTANTADETGAWMNDVDGWRSVSIRGSLGLVNTTLDAVVSGFVTTTGTNAAGYNPLGGATTSLLTCQLAGGGAAGLTAEASGWSAMLGCRIRWDAATTTAALRNTTMYINRINGTNGIVPSTNFAAAPATTDVFYIESPGVVLGNLTHTAGRNGSFSLLSMQATAASTITNPGSCTYANLTFQGSGTTTFSGGGSGTLALLGVKKDALASFFITSAFSVTVTQSAIYATPAVTGSVVAFIYGSGCVSKYGINTAFCNGTENTLIGNQSSTTSRRFRVTGNDTGAVLSLGGRGATIRGVDVSNATALSGIVYFNGDNAGKGAAGTWTIDDIVSSDGGNTLYVLNLADAGNSRAPFNATIYWGTKAANTITTSLSAGIGDWQVAYGCVVRGPEAIAYCNLLVHGWNILGGAASSTNMSGRPIITDTLVMENLDTADILPRRLVRAADADPVQFPLHGQMHVATADTAANATGVLGVLITNDGDGSGVAAGALGVVALSGLIPIQFEAAPTTGAQAYLSTLTGASSGMATVTKPANLAVYVGTVEEWSTSGEIHTGWVNFRPSPALQEDPHRKGADIASASTIAMADTLKNYFHVTGTTTIDFLSISNVFDGKEVDLYFVSTPQVNHNTGTVPAVTAPFLLTNGAARRMVAGQTASFRYDAALAAWKELDNGGSLSTAHVLLDRNDLTLFPNGVNLGALTTGLLKQTVTAGVAVFSIAVGGTDYVSSVVAGTGISVSNVLGAYTVNNTGILTATGTAAQIAVTAGQNPTFSLINTAVTPGSYTYGGFTVDAQGRLTAASNGTAPVTSIIAGTNVTVSGTTAVTVNAVVGMTTGSVLFSGASSVVSQDNANFFWDDSANRLGVGTNSPSAQLHVAGSGTTGSGQNLAWFMYSGLTTGNYMTIDFGKSSGANTSAYLGYQYSTSPANSSFVFLAHGGDGFDGIKLNKGTTVELKSLSAGGLVKAAATTGLLSIGTAGTDYAVSLVAGTAITVSNASGVWTVNNNGVTSVTAGSNITITGTANVPIIAVTAGVFQPILSLTSGSVLFSGGGSTISQDNANFFFDDTNNRLGLGTNAPSAMIHAAFPGSASTQAVMWAMVPALASGNYMTVDFGRSQGANTSGQLGFQYSTSPANSSFIFISNGGDGLDGIRVNKGTTVELKSLSAGGLVKATVTSGLLSIATPGTDYLAPFSLTSGSVVFSGGGSTLSQDNANFFWDDPNNRLGLGTASPGAQLHMEGGTSGDALRMGTGSNYYKIGRNTATGYLDHTGTQSGFSGYTFNIPGSASTDGLIQGMEASLTTGNYVTVDFGKALASNQCGQLGFTYSTSPANSSYIFLSVAGDGVTGVQVNKGGSVLIGNLAGSGNRLVLADSTGLLAPVVLGTNLAFSGTTLNATAGGGGVAAVTATAPISSSGGGSPNITHDTSGATAATYIKPSSITVNATGHITAITAASGPLSTTIPFQFASPNVNTLGSVTYIGTNTADAATWTAVPIGTWFPSESSTTLINVKCYVGLAQFIIGNMVIDVYKNNTQTIAAAVTIAPASTGTVQVSGDLGFTLNGSTDTWGLALRNAGTAVSGAIYISGFATVR